VCFSDCPRLEPLPLGAIAAGEQAVVADAVEAFGQDVDEVRRTRTGPVSAGLDPPLIAILRAPSAAAGYQLRQQFGARAAAQKDLAQVASRDARRNTSRL
jgi:hypothetical protein